MRDREIELEIERVVGVTSLEGGWGIFSTKEENRPSEIFLLRKDLSKTDCLLA